MIWAGAADAIAGLAAAMRGEEDQAEGLAADAERVVSPLGVTFVLYLPWLGAGEGRGLRRPLGTCLASIRNLSVPVVTFATWTS